MPETSNRAQRISAFGSLSSGICSIAMVFITFDIAVNVQKAGVALQKENMEREYESKAVDLFLKYDEVALKQAATSDVQSRHRLSDISIAIAESIFLNRNDSDPWKETARGILQDQKNFVLQRRLRCAQFSRRFIDFCIETIGVDQKLLCR